MSRKNLNDTDTNISMPSPRTPRTPRNNSSGITPVVSLNALPPLRPGSKQASKESLRVLKPPLNTNAFGHKGSTVEFTNDLENAKIVSREKVSIKDFDKVKKFESGERNVADIISGKRP